MGGLGPGIGGGEYFIIGLVALLVVGPERLPGLLRQLGKMVAKARGMANEFRASFDEMARQSELDDLRKEVEALRTGQGPVRLGAEAEAAFKDIKAELDKPLLTDPAMTPAPSEWPDGEPVMMPMATPPVVAPEVIGTEGAPPASAKRKAVPRTAAAKTPAGEPAAAKAAPVKAKSAARTAPRAKAPRNSKIDL